MASDSVARKAGSEASGEVRRMVERARAAQRRYERSTQAEVDTVVTAAGWAIVEPKRNRELGQLAIAARLHDRPACRGDELVDARLVIAVGDALRGARALDQRGDVGLHLKRGTGVRGSGDHAGILVVRAIQG